MKPELRRLITINTFLLFEGRPIGGTTKTEKELSRVAKRTVAID
jgi:hypothetical protein